MADKDSTAGESLRDDLRVELRDKDPFQDDSPGMLEEEAKNRIEGLLSDSEPEEAGTTEEQGATGEESPPPESESDEPEPEEAEVESDEGADSGEQPDEVEREEDSGDSESELPQTLTVKVDGEEQEVTLDEARDGYMRQAAFTRKTQELAETRREVQSLTQELAAERQEYANRLQMAERVLDALQPERPDAELRTTDPQAYAERLAEFEERQEQIESVRAERERALEQNQEQLQKVRQDQLQQEQEMLVAKIPELLDDDKRTDIMSRMVETAQEHYGFPPEQLEQVTDHRAVVMLHDAMKYHELKEKGEEVTSSKPKKDKGDTLKPGSSSPSKPKSKKSTKQASELRKRLARTGSTRHAAATLEALIGE